MRKANGILVFGVLFVLFSFLYGFFVIGLPYQDPPQELIVKRANQYAFKDTTFWSGIIIIGIGVFLRIKVKFNSK